METIAEILASCLAELLDEERILREVLDPLTDAEIDRLLALMDEPARESRP